MKLYSVRLSARPSVCHIRLLQQHVAGLLLWDWQVGGID